MPRTMRESRAGRIFLIRLLTAIGSETDDVRDIAWPLTGRVRKVDVRQRGLIGRNRAAAYVAALGAVDFFHGRFLYLLL